LANDAKIIAPLISQPQKRRKLPRLGRSDTGVAIEWLAMTSLAEQGE
jgi:hypothetical protein